MPNSSATAAPAPMIASIRNRAGLRRGQLSSPGIIMSSDSSATAIGTLSVVAPGATLTSSSAGCSLEELSTSRAACAVAVAAGGGVSDGGLDSAAATGMMVRQLSILQHDVARAEMQDKGGTVGCLDCVRAFGASRRGEQAVVSGGGLSAGR